MFFDYAYGNALFFGEFSHAGKYFAKYILHRAYRVILNSAGSLFPV